MSDPLIRCRDVAVEYRGRRRRGDRGTVVRALRGVSLEVAPGETVGIVGESGSGKSTLARAILGQAKLAAGSVERPHWGVGARELGAKASMIFQDPKSSLNPRLSVSSIVADPLVVHGRGDRDARARRVAELLADVGLPPTLQRRRARQLSGGQLQRVAVARALALEPELVVADEPTSALDVSVQAQIVNLLRSLEAEHRFAMVIVSHDIGVIRALADRVVVMYDGLIVEEGTTEEVYERPQHPYTVTLLASATTVSQAVAEEDSPAAQLSQLSRPYATEATLQRDCCPFADRCWQAAPECLEALPAERANGRGVRCVAPLSAAARAAALGRPAPGEPVVAKRGKEDR